MVKRPRLVLATANEHKVREMRALLADSGWEIVPAGPDVANVPETGKTFVENARLKAVQVARAMGQIVLADDSGLMVDALRGEPGVHSKRWAGENASDGDRIAKLLGAMAGVPDGERSARFVCAMCIADPGGVLWEGEGRVDGVIAESPSGEGGFGYDPVFVIPGLGATMASLTEEQKNEVSHRGRAGALADGWLRTHINR